jgi:hypothetical protein
MAAVFRPATVVVVSFAATCAFVVLMLVLPRFAGEGRFYLFFYHAPIAFAFMAYLFDRAGRWGVIRLRQWLVEILVIGLALSRTLMPVPFISGHALFLTYVLLTTPRRLAWWIAALVLLDVSYIKIVILHDATLIGGAIVGILAAVIAQVDKRRA